MSQTAVTLLQHLESKEGTTKDNKPWKTTTILVETDEKYPKKMALVCWGELAGKAKSISIGSRLYITYFGESREYMGKWYSDIKCSSLEAAGAAENRAANGEAAKNNPAPDPFYDDPDDSQLPF